MREVNMLDDGTVIERTDACLGVRFFWHELLNEERTKEAGIPKYDQIEMVEIVTPGSRDRLHRKVNDMDKMRFKDRYKSFIELANEKMDGTPLNQFPFISVGEIRELEYFNVYTGEQLVNMPDGNIEKLGVNGRDLIKKVNAFMQMAKDTAVVARMTDENESLKREMDLMKEQMSQILRMKQEKEPEATVKTKGKKG
jgi:hypothetical protein